jgi:Spy/CpxP family protein refolding chaperone
MNRINRLHSETKKLHAEMADHRLEGILEVREILTPEQFSEFMELTGKHRRGKGMRHGPDGLSED